jgi:3-methyladenine DNA glycosylase AlkD
MDNEELILQIRKYLQDRSDEVVRISSQRYFKESVRCYGLKTPVLRRIAREYLQRIRHLPKEQIFGLCEELWRSGYIEECGIACEWSYALRKHYTPSDWAVFERWVERYVDNWATCDTLCNHSVGDFLERHPSFLPELERWAISPNRWMRRASAVSLIVPARRGKFRDQIFRLAEILLCDRDDMVQKGYGWMLKAASQAHTEDVFRFVMRHKARMPRTALRYAIEKMPENLRKEAMAK